MTDDSPVVVRLGNPAPHEPKIEEGRVVGTTPRHDLGEVATTMHLPKADVAPLLGENAELAAALEDRHALLSRVLTGGVLDDWEVALRHIAIVVAQHARAGVSWVAAEESELETLLAKFFGTKQGEPEGFADQVAERHAKLGESPAAGGGHDAVPADVADLAQTEQKRWPEIEAGLRAKGDPLALKTKKGLELVASASFGTAAQPAALNYFALTENNEAEKDTSTTLTGEYTTASGGLLRKQATYAYTEGTATATLTVTWTANGSDTLPFTAHKFGVFNKATSGGTMGIETKITATTWNASGDAATLTESIALS